MQEARLVSKQQEKQWLSAAKQGEADSLTALLQYNASLLHHQGSGIGHTALHWSAAKGHLDCLRWLLQQGADINSLNAEDSSPLHAAAANGQEAVVRFLLDQPAMKVSATDSSGETAKQVADSKKWLAVAALIPDSASSGTGALQASTASSEDPLHMQHSQQMDSECDPNQLAEHTRQESAADSSQAPASLDALILNDISLQQRQHGVPRESSLPKHAPGDSNAAQDASGNSTALADFASSSRTGTPQNGQQENGHVCNATASADAHSQAAPSRPCIPWPNATDFGCQQSASEPEQGAQDQHATTAGLSSDAAPATRMSGSSSGSMEACSASGSTAEQLVIKEHGKAWLDAARYGKLHSMKALLKTSGAYKATLVAYNGTGTSYGLMGHTALHWAAAKGYTGAVAWLLHQGADANSPNQGGSTPLHSAAGHGQAAAAEMLMYMGLADALRVEMCGETPKSLALSLGHAGLALQIDLGQHVNTLRGQQQREWDMRTVRELLQLAGFNMAALLERHEVMSACQQQLDKKPKAVGLALLQPKTCMSSAGSDSWDPKPSLSGTKGTSDTDVAQLDSDDDEDVWTEAAAAAKQKGNELYQRAEHQHAVQMYTMAINLQTQIALHGSSFDGGPDPLSVLYSNRSAANASLRHWDEALEDAEACIAFAPKWSKGHCRAAVAFWAQGHGNKAIAAYNCAIDLDPSCQPALQALEKLSA